MKKRKFALIIALLIGISAIMISCTATPEDNAPATDAETPPAADEGDATTTSEGDTPADGDAAPAESAYDQLMKLQENPETALALSGVQPKSYESRADVPKGLPVQPKAAKDLKIGWAAASLGSEFFEGLRDSAQAQAKKYGIPEIDLQNADFNLETQQQQVDTFITNKIDALILNAVDLHSSVQMIQKVVDAGIPVLVTGPTAAKPEYQIITAIISGSNESGFQVGLYCAEKLYKKGEVLKVGMVISKLEDADSNSRPCGWIAGYLYKAAEIDGTPYESKYDAILEAFNVWMEYKNNRKYDLSEKGLNLVELGVGEGTDAAKGQTATADILISSADMDLLVVEMDSMAVGALAEIKQQGKTPGQDIKVVTCADGTKTALDYIKAGELMATATNIPFMAATSMVDIIYQLFDGDDTTGFNEYSNDMPATSFTPTMAITAENVDQYYPDVDDPIFGKFAKYDPYTPLSIPEYNDAHAND
jgi:ABC-type sugar transport system substrate-binding protein